MHKSLLLPPALGLPPVTQFAELNGEPVGKAEACQAKKSFGPVGVGLK